MTTTTAGALDPEDIGQEITIHLPGKPRKGQLTGIHHGRDNMIRIELAGHHIIVRSTMPITITHTVTGD